MLRFLTAGESHGPSLVMILEGMPAGLAIDFDAITAQLRRRQGGYGRGRRMAIESAPTAQTPGVDRPLVTRPRPGHADLAGVAKYGHEDVRNVLERASARETASRV